MARKLRPDLPMFNFEHSFEILTTQASWVLASRGKPAVGAPATELRTNPQRLAETVQGRVAIAAGGVTHDGALWRLEPEAWQEVLDVNVTGAFNCIQAVAQPMRAQRYGKIVNVASHQAFRPGFGIANYAASKAALIGLTKSAAVDL